MKAILGESNLHFYSLSALASSLNATESLALLQQQQLLLLLLGKLGQFQVSFQAGSGFRCSSQILNLSRCSFSPKRPGEIRMHDSPWPGLWGDSFTLPLSPTPQVRLCPGLLALLLYSRSPHLMWDVLPSGLARMGLPL